jgi:5-methylcytosine-specific restriction endonuclease McrA
METTTLIIIGLIVVFVIELMKKGPGEEKDVSKNKHEGLCRDLEAHYQELYAVEAEELETDVYETETVYVCENCGWTGGRKEVDHKYFLNLGVVASCPSCGRCVADSTFDKKTALTPDHPNYYACKRRQDFFYSYMKEQSLREQSQYAPDEELPEFSRRIKTEEQKRSALFRGTDPKPSPRHIPTQVKREVWIRDQSRCTQCGSKEKLEFDHIIPVSRGGSNTVRNIQLLCEGCNRKKSNNIE